MGEEIRFYKGKFKVRVINESKGFWTVEALEDFEDVVENSEVLVKAGERRIVPSNTVHRNQNIPAPIREHSYELKMEKKVKQMVAGKEKKEKEEIDR